MTESFIVTDSNVVRGLEISKDAVLRDEYRLDRKLDVSKTFTPRLWWG